MKSSWEKREIAQFRVSPKLLSVSMNSIETRKIFSISFIKQHLENKIYCNNCVLIQKN